MRRMVAGWIVTLAGLALATAGLLPFRSDITVAPAALVLVVPVALGVAVGGFPAVPFGVAAGFLTFDFVFIPPYSTFYVTEWEDWVSLVVYALVGCTVGVVVAQLGRAQREAEARRAETRRLWAEPERPGGGAQPRPPPGEVLPLADIDYLLVEQVLSNLLENAARYAPPGTEVTVRAVAVAGTDEVEVAVVDHGPGVAEGERERIFDEFYRPRVEGRGPVGTGMGLAIVKGIVEAHGGRIWVEPTPGGGATFALRLPVAPDTALPEDTEASTARA